MQPGRESTETYGDCGREWHETLLHGIKSSESDKIKEGGLASLVPPSAAITASLPPPLHCRRALHASLTTPTKCYTTYPSSPLPQGFLASPVVAVPCQLRYYNPPGPWSRRRRRAASLAGISLDEYDLQSIYSLYTLLLVNNSVALYETLIFLSFICAFLVELLLNLKSIILFRLVLFAFSWIL